jgi:two-component system NtrC family sensor kinase
MTIRSRLLFSTVTGLILIMAFWSWIQIHALRGILLDQELQILNEVSETVGEYYQHFPTDAGLTTMDTVVDQLLQESPNLARIDVFTFPSGKPQTVIGASRVRYEWEEKALVEASRQARPVTRELAIADGPALGLLYPVPASAGGRDRILVGAILLTRSSAEIIRNAKRLFLYTGAGLSIGLILLLSLIYRVSIGKPLEAIIGAIDAYQDRTVLSRVLAKRKDEWGRLSRHFNRMADNMDEALRANRELNRRLEEKVQEATLKVVLLQRQVDQLQRLSTVGQVAANLAHNLGTPLHSIAGLVQLLLEQKQWPPDVHRKLELIHQQAARLDAIIQNVRRATRPPEPHMEPTNLAEVLNETLLLVEPWIHRLGIDLSLEISPDLPSLYVDRYGIETALFNLIQNAVEAMPHGGRISISAKREERGRAIVLAVEDTGSGILPEIRDRIFEPFVSTRDGQGIKGLGLAIVQDIVRMHRGRIEVKSEPEAGTRVLLYLPVLESASGAAAPPSSPDKP